MANKKKEYYKPGPMTEGKRNIIQGLLQEYNIETAADIQEALKDLLGGTIKEMMEAEMNEHLGYEKSQRSDSDDARNGYKSKHITTSYGGMKIEVPQDRKSTFEPQVVRKRQKDISDIDQKIISMYAKGMTTRQISDTLMDIYGFDASEGFIPLSGIRRYPHPRCGPAGGTCSPETRQEAQAEGLTDTTIQTQKSPPSAEDFLHSEGLLKQVVTETDGILTSKPPDFSQ